MKRFALIHVDSHTVRKHYHRDKSFDEPNAGAFVQWHKLHTWCAFAEVSSAPRLCAMLPTTLLTTTLTFKGRKGHAFEPPEGLVRTRIELPPKRDPDVPTDVEGDVIDAEEGARRVV